MSLETPQEVNFFRGGSSHARGKRPPVVKGNGVTVTSFNRMIINNRQIFKPKHIIRGGKNMKQASCLACQGTGMLADDEGWQYECSVCSGTGKETEGREVRVMEVDSNN